jgi:hypothetical protein
MAKFYPNYPNNPNCPNYPNYPNSLGMFQTKAGKTDQKFNLNKPNAQAAG